LTNKLILHYPDIDLVFGVPLIIIFGVIFMMVFLAYFGDKIYNWDLKVVYGGVLRKLDEIIVDLEELRNQTINTCKKELPYESINSLAKAGFVPGAKPTVLLNRAL